MNGLHRRAHEASIEQPAAVSRKCGAHESTRLPQGIEQRIQLAAQVAPQGRVDLFVPDGIGDPDQGADHRPHLLSGVRRGEMAGVRGKGKSAGGQRQAGPLHRDRRGQTGMATAGRAVGGAGQIIGHDQQ
jgi:hypothetical protein